MYDLVWSAFALFRWPVHIQRCINNSKGPSGFPKCSEQASDTIAHIHASLFSHSLTVCPRRNTLHVKTQASGKCCGPIHDSSSVGNQKITKKLCVLTVIYTTGDRNFITLITKLKWLRIKAMDQIHTSAYLQMINVLPENIFSIPYWCIILSSQTSVTAGPCRSVKDLP